MRVRLLHLESIYTKRHGHRWHKTKEQKPWNNTKQIFPKQKTKTSFVLRYLCTVHKVLTGIFSGLISGQIVNSFGQGRCAFDCQSGNFKNYATGNHVSTSSCMLRIEKLITLNMTCIWTFHTNSLLHGYFFSCMYTNNYEHLHIKWFGTFYRANLVPMRVPHIQ